MPEFNYPRPEMPWETVAGAHRDWPETPAFTQWLPSMREVEQDTEP